MGGLLSLEVYLFTLILISETHFKDNPGLSMLNDSDEEVHYG